MTDKTRRYRVAVIPGDGIGKEVVPEGVRVLEKAARQHGFELALDWFDFASCDYYERHGRMMPEDWKAQIGGHDAIFFGAVGMARAGAGPHLALGLAAAVPARVRPIRQPASGAPDARRPVPARRPHIPATSTSGSCARTPRASTRTSAAACSPVRSANSSLQETIMTRHGVDRVLRYAFDLAPEPPEEAPHLGDQVERHLDHDALLGRAGRGDGARLPGRALGQVPHRHPDRAFRAEPGPVRRGGRLEPLRRHPLGPRSGLHRDDRHRAVGQHQSRPDGSLAVRAGARLGARHRRPGHRQSGRPDLVGRR